MTPFYEDPIVTLYLGDCLEVLPQLPSESVDSICTDPPYGISFMGRHWDHGVPGVDFWKEMLRVLKPGGYLLSFASTRTVHRFGVAIEDAGFEIRDTLMWIYASGFPKSLDVSKALDKRGGADIAWFGPWLRQERERRGITQKSLAVHFPSKTGNLTGCVANWELGLNLPTVEQFNTLCEVLELPFTRIEEAEREVIATRRVTDRRGDGTVVGLGHSGNADITVASSDLARQWEGWGTALKPAHEPIVMARKPLIGTVAANVSRYGVGALNIDGTRIGPPMTEAEIARSGKSTPGMFGLREVDWKRDGVASQGRWPSNVLLSDPELFDEPNPYVVGSGATSEAKPERVGLRGGTAWHGQDGFGSPDQEGRWPADPGGGYSRFFLIPKADRAERERGLAAFEQVKQNAVGPATVTARDWSDPNAKQYERNSVRANVHPTVKPIDLMRHLVRLVTPPGGVTLDPFLGSGTTVLAASEEGFRCIGIEREAEYLKIAKGRLMATPMGLGLDVPAPTRRLPSDDPRGPHRAKSYKDTTGFTPNLHLSDEEPAA